MATFRTRGGRIQVQVRRDGHPPASATFDNKQDAQRWARNLEAKLDDGVNATVARVRTLADAIVEFRESGLGITTEKDRTRYIDWWLTHYGHVTLLSLRPAMVNKARKQLEAEPNGGHGRAHELRSPQTVRHYLMGLSKVMSYARDTLQWVVHNPVDGADVPPVSLPTVKYANDDQRKQLMDACAVSANPDLDVVAEIIFSSGARISEVVALRWSWINFTDKVAYLPHSKNGDAKALPLVGRALTLLQARYAVRNPRNDLVFPSPVKPNQPRNMRNAWNVARARAGMTGKGYGFHLARHTAATNMIRADVSPELVMRVLGQRSAAMARRYQHLLHGIVVKAAERGLAIDTPANQ